MSIIRGQVVGSYWHNGNRFYTVVSEDDISYMLMGGTLHEGGFYAHVQKSSNVDHLIFKGQTGNSFAGISYYFDGLVYTYVNGRKALLQYGPVEPSNNTLIRQL